MAPSYEDINNNNLISKITIGKCGHAFHSECINNYCKKNVSCPIDFTHWEMLKDIEGPVLVSIKPNTSSTKQSQNNEQSKIQSNNNDNENKIFESMNKLPQINMLNTFGNIKKNDIAKKDAAWGSYNTINQILEKMEPSKQT
jgi:hypothetical protein